MKTIKTLSLLAITAAALSATPMAHAAPRSCAWPAQFTADQANVLYPDEAAKYWAGALPIPAGGHIEVAGQYPHARYTSLITYTPQTQAIDGLNDQQITPDPGSSNPFLAKADRTVTRRSYTVRIVAGQPPAAGREPNTLYTTNADGSKTSGSLAIVMLRIYVPDRGTGITGGVALPKVSIVSATGTKTALPDCPLDTVPDTGANEKVASSGSDHQLPRLGLFGRDPVRWHKFVNVATGLVQGYAGNAVAGDSVAPAAAAITAGAFPTGGFAENIDNKYVYATMDRTYGQVLVLRAKAPTTPATLDGERRMGTGQLRYWSMCTENGQTTAFYGCAHDEQVPLDKRGYYTIVISTKSARPANATARCGVVWLPAGPHLQTLLLMRNMLPAPTFEWAIQNARVGHEREDMGDYHPTGTYYATPADYRKTGCRRQA